MPNDLTISRETPPATIGAKVADYAAALKRRGVASWSISDRRAPAGADRVALIEREAALRASLEPSPAQAIQKPLVRMFMGFPSAANLDTAGTVAAYASALATFPAWAVENACAAALRGGIGNPSFAPSAAELAKHCEQAISGAASEARLINRILNADVFHEPDEAEQARVQEKFRALAAELGMTTWGRGDAA